MKLSTLKKEAQHSTKFRGHSMKWGDPYGNATTQVFSQSATCRRCGRGVTIHMNPAPNQINVSGPAVAVNCSDI